MSDNKVKTVFVHLLSQSEAMQITDVVNTYQKGDLFCVLTKDNTVYKYPIMHIFCITEKEV